MSMLEPRLVKGGNRFDHGTTELRIGGECKCSHKGELIRGGIVGTIPNVLDLRETTGEARVEVGSIESCSIGFCPLADKVEGSGGGVSGVDSQFPELENLSRIVRDAAWDSSDVLRIIRIGDAGEAP